MAGDEANKEAKANIPTPAEADYSAEVDKYYPGIEPFKYLGGKLLALIAALALLAAGAAAIRQYIIEWPPLVRLAAVTKRDLPAYHRIQSTDLKSELRFAGEAEAQTLKKVEEVVGRYTLEALPKEKPVVDAHLGPWIDRAQFAAKVVVELPASAAMILPDGMLKPGDVVDLVLELPPAKGQPPASPQHTTVIDVLVLNVKTLEKAAEPTSPGQPEKKTLLVLAVPADRHAELTPEGAKLTLLSVRKKILTR
jgi:Flp pilus assembly protein CpaB